MLYRAFFCTRMTISHKQVIHVFPTICISLNIFIVIIEIKKHRSFCFQKENNYLCIRKLCDTGFNLVII